VKRAYLTNGSLAALARPQDNILLVDTDTWMYLNSILSGDYCYLVVDNLEVVKVQSLEAPNVLLVVRGIDETKRGTWGIGTSIKYGITGAEINDAVTHTGTNITATYPLTYIDGILSYPEMDILGIGGITVNGSNEGSWMIQNIPDNVGCGCLETALPPPIPLRYFHLRIVTEGYYRSTENGDYRGYL
jgi:hypothetical protein